MLKKSVASTGYNLIFYDSLRSGKSKDPVDIPAVL